MYKQDVLSGNTTNYVICSLYVVVASLVYDTRSKGQGRKEGNVLFNDALNTFYLRLYDVKHMVKDHSDSEK